MSVERELVERREENGGAIELWRRGEHYDVIIEERTVMSSDERRSEQPMAELAVVPWQGRDDVTVLVAGLGMGFLVRAMLDSPLVARVDVVEASRAILDWEAEHFSKLNGGVTADKRVHVHHAELGEFLRGPTSARVPGGWMVIAIDTDEWPFTLSRPENLELYNEEGMALLEDALRPGGVLAMWATQKDDDLYKRFHQRFQNVARIGVPVEVRGHASLDYVIRGRKHPPPQSSSGGGMPN